MYFEALLEDADRLAAQGRYGEAAHLLLQRSVSQIGLAVSIVVQVTDIPEAVAIQVGLVGVFNGKWSLYANNDQRNTN